MASTVAMPVEEYLRSSWRPDREYIDGATVERTGGDLIHATLIIQVGELLKKRGLVAGGNPRIRVRSDRIRIPDVIAVRELREHWLVTEPPYSVVEIISRDDRALDIMERVKDFLDFGVPNIWFVDMWHRAVIVYTREGSRTLLDSVTTSDGAISIPVNEIFAGIPEIPMD